VGELLKNRKGGLFCLGSGTDTPVLHHPTYNFPDDILSTGVKMFYEIAKRTIHQSS
jgi:metal-dependent amidase/aminoacylase/carboxypeptidase family protein